MAIPGIDDVHKISIIPRGIAALGYTMQVPTEDRFLMTEGELKNKIAVLLGGRAAEELIYEEASTGAHDDLTKATDIARSMIKTFGMSPKLGQISFERDRRTMLVQSPELVGRHATTARRPRARSTSRSAASSTSRSSAWASCSRSGSRSLMRAARTLIARETITGAELRAIALASDDGGSIATDGEATDGQRGRASDAWLGP